jgi:hypothetical protein
MRQPGIARLDIQLVGDECVNLQKPAPSGEFLRGE